jgi:hypothetical protein
MADTEFVTMKDCREVSDNIIDKLDSLENSVREQHIFYRETLFGKENAGKVEGGIVHYVRKNLEALNQINGSLEHLKTNGVEEKKSRRDIAIEIIKVIGFIAVAIIGALNLRG